MTESIGTEHVLGFVQGVAWGTEVLVAATHQVPFISADPTPDAQLIQSARLNGTPFRGAGFKGNEFHSGTLRFPLDFETAHRIFAFSFASVTAPAQQGLDNAWEHEIIVAGSDKGIFATLVIGQLGVFVREYPSVKFGDITLSVAAGEEPYIEVSVVPDKLVLDDSGTNKLSTLAAVTEPGSELVKFQDISLLMIDQSGGAPTDPTDRFEISGFEMSLTKNLRTDSVTTRNAPYIDEPVRNSWFDMSLKFQTAELEDADRITEAFDKTVKKAILLADGGLADGATNYQMRFEMSSFQFQNPESVNPTGPGVIAPAYSAMGSKADAAPTGMASADQIRVFIINTDSVSPLA